MCWPNGHLVYLVWGIFRASLQIQTEMLLQNSTALHLMLRRTLKQGILTLVLFLKAFLEPFYLIPCPSNWVLDNGTVCHAAAVDS